jgi:hypothetical protein
VTVITAYWKGSRKGYHLRILDLTILDLTLDVIILVLYFVTVITAYWKDSWKGSRKGYCFRILDITILDLRLDVLVPHSPFELLNGLHWI